MGQISAKVAGSIVVFGASCGLGSAIATALADLGVTMARLHYSNQTAAVELVQRIGNGASVHQVCFAGGYGI
jgi:NADP-dependent 3-hydroxy acid dehydrogenase YdfG